MAKSTKRSASAKTAPLEFSYREFVANPRFVYNVKFVCGLQKRPFDGPCSNILNMGIYSTEINILNFGLREVTIFKIITPLVLKNESVAPEPKFSRPRNGERVTLPPLSATMDDCCKLSQMLKLEDEQLKIGFLEIVSPVELEVVAVYSVTNIQQDHPDISVLQIQGKRLALR